MRVCFDKRILAVVCLFNEARTSCIGKLEVVTLLKFEITFIQRRPAIAVENSEVLFFGAAVPTKEKGPLLTLGLSRKEMVTQIAQRGRFYTNYDHLCPLTESVSETERKVHKIRTFARCR